MKIALNFAKIALHPFVFFGLVLFPAVGLAAPAADLNAIQSHRLRILYNRVHETLSYRYEAAGKCVLATRSLDAARLRAALAPLLKAHGLAPTAEDVEDLLAAYRESEALGAKGSPCRKYVRAGDTKLSDREQKPFETAITIARGACFLEDAIRLPLIPLGGVPSSCPISADALIASLHPFCATKVAAALDGSMETNPCFAGDRLVTAGLESKKAADISAEVIADGFLSRIESMVSRAAGGSGVELLAAYPLLRNIRNFESRKRFLALLAFFYASPGSDAGYVDGFGDHFWRDSLKQGKGARESLVRYLEWKNRRDRFALVLGAVAGKKLRLRVNGHDFTAANRHEIMSAFLACHFRGLDEDLAAEVIPLMLGYAYEGKDFVSHLEGGAGVKESIRNFRADTGRYHRGMEFGYAFCWD